MKEIFFDSIDSTNTYLKSNYEKLDDFCFVRADLQTGGKGRNNRKWLSNRGENLLFSLLIKDEELIDKYQRLSMNSAYLVLKLLEEYGLKGLSIKWPNDVYVDDKKICGILLEAVSKQKIECLIIGIGINVNQESFEGDYLHEPVSICQILHKKIDIIEFKNRLFVSLNENLGNDYLDQIRNYDYLKGKTVEAMINKRIKEVKAVGINDDYSLKVIADDSETDIASGEISFHVREEDK